MDAQPLADLLQALADPTRLRILALLRRMELSVGELAIILDQSQPRVSRHVRILADAGNAADNALDAAGNAVENAGNAVENAGDAVANAAENAAN